MGLLVSNPANPCTCAGGGGGDGESPFWNYVNSVLEFQSIPAPPPNYSWKGVVDNVDGGTRGYTPNLFFTLVPISGLSPDIFLFPPGDSGISGTGNLLVELEDVITGDFFTVAGFSGPISSFAIGSGNYLGFSLGASHVLPTGSILPDGFALTQNTWTYTYTIGNLANFYNAVFTASFNYSGTLNFASQQTGSAFRLVWSK